MVAGRGSFQHHQTSFLHKYHCIALTANNNLMSREIIMAGGGCCKKNDGWDMDNSSSREITGIMSSLCSPLETTSSSSKPLDNFLSGQHDHNCPFELTLSIPTSSNDDHENGEDEGSVMSEVTMMTYRAEAMKEVSKKNGLREMTISRYIL